MRRVDVAVRPREVDGLDAQRDPPDGSREGTRRGSTAGDVCREDMAMGAMRGPGSNQRGPDMRTTSRWLTLWRRRPISVLTMGVVVFWTVSPAWASDPPEVRVNILNANSLWSDEVNEDLSAAGSPLHDEAVYRWTVASGGGSIDPQVSHEPDATYTPGATGQVVIQCTYSHPVHGSYTDIHTFYVVDIDLELESPQVPLGPLEGADCLVDLTVTIDCGPEPPGLASLCQVNHAYFGTGLVQGWRNIMKTGDPNICLTDDMFWESAASLPELIYLEGKAETVVFDFPLPTLYLAYNPNPGGQGSRDFYTGTTFIVNVPDCRNGGAENLHISTDGTSTLHINDPADAETLTALGNDPDDSISCGCSICAPDGMNLDATHWTTPDQHIVCDPPYGETTEVCSWDNGIGQFRVRATFHDHASPSRCNDEEGENWTTTKMFQTFKIGVRLSVDGGPGPQTLWETDTEQSKEVSHTFGELWDWAGSGALETITNSRHLQKESKATFVLTTHPPELPVKGLVRAHIGAEHDSFRAGGVTWDDDPSDLGTHQLSVSIIPGVVTITPNFNIKGDDAVGGVGIGYGASLNGVGSTGGDVSWASRASHGEDRRHWAVPAWSPPATSFVGRPGEGDATKYGEVELYLSLEIYDTSTIYSVDTEVHCDNACDGDDELDQVTWRLTDRPEYLPQ